MHLLRAHLGAGAGSIPGAAIAGRGQACPQSARTGGTDDTIFGSVECRRPGGRHRRHERRGSGVRDVIDPDLTSEVEGLVERSLSEYAGLERTPIPASPAPVPTGVATGIPGSEGAPFVEIPLLARDGYTPLTDLDALYGVYGYSLPAAAAPAHGEPPADLVDDTPAMIAAWGNPPPDAK